MKKHVRMGIISVLFLAITASAYFFLIGPDSAGACGYGSSGGSDYVPQRRGPAGYTAQKSAITLEQAQAIVARHIRKLNPDLQVGNINDAGGFFEAEILSKDREVVQLLGVDKYSGQLLLLN